MSENTCIGALDIGGTKIAAMVADASGPLARLTQPTAKTGSPRALPEQCVALLEAACRQAGIDAGRLSRVGVGSAGPFERSGGMIGLASPNICGGGKNDPALPNDWEVVPLEQVLRERFAHVTVDNDCVVALAAERTFGAARDERDCAYVTWSTGIGFGFCVDGHILRGKNGNAGHAGHMLLSEREDAVCGCGNRGDLEALISGRNVGNRLNISAVELFGSARAGNAEAHEAALQAARWFGRGLYNVTAALDTRLFVIGGSVWTHHGAWLLPVVLRELESHLPALTRDVSLLPAALGGLVADVGALSLVMPAEWVARWRDSKPWSKMRGAPDVS